jgi:hypothetical protein
LKQRLLILRGIPWLRAAKAQQHKRGSC